LIEGWGLTRANKFFKDVDLWRVWSRSGKGLLTSKPYRLTDVFHSILSRHQDMLFDVIREALRTQWELLGWERQFSRDLKEKTLAELFEDRHVHLMQSLKHDGFKFQNGELTPLSLEETQEERDEVRLLLTRHGFSVALSHLDQAIDNYILSNWEAANAQIRTFFEGLYDEIALKLYPDEAQKIDPGGNRRKLLQDKGFIDRDWAPTMQGFSQTANTKGAHPGLSNEDDCRLRCHLVIGLARYSLRKIP
jgi:hypothetical protein